MDRGCEYEESGVKAGRIIYMSCPAADAFSALHHAPMPYAPLFYGHGRRSLARMCEPPADPLNEADLSTIWAGQRFPPEALTMADGRWVNVLNPGRPNAGAGPDFRDAVFELDGKQRLGDVELHVRASSFRGHGHHLDHAYDGVALHVVYLADEGAETVLAGGGRAPVACFAPWLIGRAEELQSWLAAPAFWQDPCRDAAARLGDEGVNAALREAGQKRFQSRVQRMACEIAISGEAEALWRALLDALGVGGDRDGFRRLAGAFPAALASDIYAKSGAEGLEAALLAVAGLGGARGELADLLPCRLSPAIERPGRPLNRPERRLAALARLVHKANGDMAALALSSVAEVETAKQLVLPWVVADPSGGPALLGFERAQELLVNAVLPFAACKEELRTKADWLLLQLPPGQPYGKTAFLEANLARVGGKRRVRNALEQQGLLTMLDEWCRRGGCGRCPLS
jgi:hypothetical protein